MQAHGHRLKLIVNKTSDMTIHPANVTQAEQMPNMLTAIYSGRWAWTPEGCCTTWEYGLKPGNLGYLGWTLPEVSCRKAGQIYHRQVTMVIYVTGASLLRTRITTRVRLILGWLCCQSCEKWMCSTAFPWFFNTCSIIDHPASKSCYCSHFICL